MKLVLFSIYFTALTKYRLLGIKSKFYNCGDILCILFILVLNMSSSYDQTYSKDTSNNLHHTWIKLYNLVPAYRVHMSKLLLSHIYYETALKPEHHLECILKNKTCMITDFAPVRNLLEDDKKAAIIQGALYGYTCRKALSEIQGATKMLQALLVASETRLKMAKVFHLLRSLSTEPDDNCCNHEPCDHTDESWDVLV